MWRRLLHPSAVRPAASAAGLAALQSWQPSWTLRSYDQDRHPVRQVFVGHHILQCSPKQNVFACSGCNDRLPRSSFSKKQLGRNIKKCKQCTAKHTDAATTVTCTQCGEDLPSESFATRQLRRSTRVCCTCARSNDDQEHVNKRNDFIICSVCAESLPRDAFSDRQKERQKDLGGKTCRACTNIGPPSHALARIDLGSLSDECTFCSAKRFPCEGDSFCCGRGKHHVDFEKYYKPPQDALLDIFAQTWPYKDAAGQFVHDSRTNAPRLTGFSAMSRRYNSLFSLAMHEIHSTTAERELHFGNELRPYKGRAPI